MAIMNHHDESFIVTNPKNERDTNNSKKEEDNNDSHLQKKQKVNHHLSDTSSTAAAISLQSQRKLCRCNTKLCRIYLPNVILMRKRIIIHLMTKSDIHKRIEEFGNRRDWGKTLSADDSVT